MLRFLLLASFVVLFLFLTLPLLLAEWLVGKCNPGLKTASCQAIIRWAFRVCLWIAGVRVTVLGGENILRDEAALYVANHRSYFDILLTHVQMKRPTGFVAKKEMGRIPSLSLWMKNIHCLFLDRSDIRQGLETVLAGADKMKNGISLVIFPEGARNRTDDPFLPFHAASLKPAEKSGCPIVPLAISNAGAIFEDHLPCIKKAHVVMEFGRPIYPKELDRESKKNLAADVESQIKRMYFSALPDSQ